MATKAYFMIRVKKNFCWNSQMEDIVAELETIPEVKCIEPINGVCDLLVTIEAPIRAVLTANKVLAMDWVKDLRMLQVESSPAGIRQKLAERHVLKTRSNHTQLLESAPTSRAKEQELERIHVHKEPLGTPTGYQSSLVEEAEKIIRRRHCTKSSKKLK